ncbi:zinc finger protein 653 [Trichomycterus rosablanca]|uniref:zinc finger protein 653 n=1 Tax=Trichomycterus rosablanca TaxID=2290929 RepID=UPI002F352877
MAAACTESTTKLHFKQPRDQMHSLLRRCRGRPRLSDSDRARRRLESRKKYDVRRVYLGESHKIWSELRERSSMSDAALAEYLILLNCTYGHKYQLKYCKKKNMAELCRTQKKGTKVPSTSLQSLLSWYQEHSRMCPHEPELHAVEPSLGLSISVLWQCSTKHSFVQQFSWPAGGDSESEEDDNDSAEQEEDGRADRITAAAVNTNTQATDEGDSTTPQVSEVADQMSTTVFSHLPETFAMQSHPIASSPSLENQDMWESGTEREEETIMPEYENKLGDGFPRKDISNLKTVTVERDQDEIEDFKCVVINVALMDSLVREDGASHVTEDVEENRAQPMSQGLAHIPSAVTPVQADMYETSTQQSVVESCELPDKHITVQGSQLIIITDADYEAMMSEGVPVNTGGEDVEEVTCTVKHGMSYNQSETVLQNSIPETDVTGLNKKKLLKPSEESHHQREVQRCLNRTKRSRRGPVIEADGMLKMFHCPYEGCSQVYVAISSFQNHVNLVHRKGRTKVCPHPGCGKKFYLSNHLHRHMIIHSGVRDFICETCGKSFKRKNHLEVHRRTHTGETPLQCEICGYQCRQRASLNWHMKKHTSEAHFSYTCEHCGKRFEKLDSVKFHKLKSHPDKEPA